MSAYVNGRNNRIIPLTEVADSIQSELSNEVPEILPPLPKIENDIQAYTTLARKIEAALIQEKSNSKQYREDLILFQQKYNRFVGEVETQFREHLLREEQLKAQISNYQQIEKSTQLQMNDLLRELSSLRDFKKKAELEMELMRTTIETTKHREGMLQNSLSSVQTNEKTHLQRIEELTKELGTVQKELNRYQASWGQVSGYHQRAKQIQIEYQEMKRRIEELNEALTVERKCQQELEDAIKAEKRRASESEELMKKEKREKQLALTYLHTAESKLATAEVKLKKATYELEHSAGHSGVQFQEDGLELKF